MAATSKGIPIDRQLDDLVTEFALLIAGAHRAPSAGSAPQDDVRAYALAVIEACTSFTRLLDQRADDAAQHARASHASYAEIGAKRGISRQAARQAMLRHRQRARERHDAWQASLPADPDDDRDFRYQQDLFLTDMENRWPPRSWQHRAPTGLRTVHLLDGPAADHTFRLPAGDDAFPFIDHYEVFGRRHDRYARYTAVSPTSDQYRFTGEYFIRWS